MTAATGSSSATVATRPRGVMISCARRSPKSSERCSSAAVPRFERALLGRAPHERRELLRRARRRQLLLRLDPDPPQDGVGRAVEQPHDPARGAREPAQEALDGARRRQRLRDREVLGHELAEDHRHAGGEHERDHQRDARDGAVGDAGGLQRPVDQLGDRRLGQEADQQVGQGDADLRRDSCVDRLRSARLHAAGAAIALLGGALDRDRSTVTSANSAATNAPQATTSASATRIRRISINARPSAERRRERAWDYSWGRRSSTTAERHRWAA